MGYIASMLFVAHSKDLPVEGMAGIWGWVFIVFCFLLMWGAAAFTAAFACKMAAGAIRGLRIAPRDPLGCGLAIYLAMWSVLAIPVTALLLWSSLHQIIYEPPEFIRFDANDFTLVYRLPWFNEHIPYRSVTRIELKPAKQTRGYHRQWPVAEVLVFTPNRTYKIRPPTRDSDERARAIYEELERHSARPR